MLFVDYIYIYVDYIYSIDTTSMSMLQLELESNTIVTTDVGVFIYKNGCCGTWLLGINFQSNNETKTKKVINEVVNEVDK